MVGMLRFYALLEYCGTDLHGSQEQRSVSMRTVQGEFWSALRHLHWDAFVHRLHCVSRTDAGVHAHGQVLEFDAEPVLLAKSRDICRALNHALPEDIAVRYLQGPFPLDTAPSVQAGVLCKWYRYRWHISNHHAPLAKRNATLIQQPLDITRMNSMAQQLTGTHDFADFASSTNSALKNTHATLHYVHVLQQSSRNITLDIVGNRFLYKMVRNIAAYLQYKGESEVAFPPFTDVTNARGREAFTRTAPANGLTLMAVLHQVPEIQFDCEHHHLLRCALNKDFTDVQDLFRQSE
jgi:tRNA pseudouridine38-40 synthase